MKKIAKNLIEQSDADLLKLITESSDHEADKAFGILYDRYNKRVETM